MQAPDRAIYPECSEIDRRRLVPLPGATRRRCDVTASEYEQTPVQRSAKTCHPALERVAAGEWDCAERLLDLVGWPVVLEHVADPAAGQACRVML
jgi:hypothetical protein